MMKRMIKGALVALGVVVALASPALAQMPQTDTSLVKLLSGQSQDKVLTALEVYYDLHVSELDVQVHNELRTGAFFAVRRVQKAGADAVATAEKNLKKAGAALNAIKEKNRALRARLLELTGIDFADSLVMTPDVPDELPAAASAAPAGLLSARGGAWGQVEKARATLRDVRLQLLEDQERYDKTRDVSIGNSMRAMTRAEIAMARAACDLRLNEAKIAAATGNSIAEVLDGF